MSEYIWDGNCSKHGSWHSTMIDECPVCMKEQYDQDLNIEHQNMAKEETCQICKKQFKPDYWDKDYSTGNEYPGFRRISIIEEAGSCEDWEKTDWKTHMCEKCFNELILPIIDFEQKPNIRIFYKLLQKLNSWSSRLTQITGFSRDYEAEWCKLSERFNSFFLEFDLLVMERLKINKEKGFYKEENS